MDVNAMAGPRQPARRTRSLPPLTLVKFKDSLPNERRRAVFAAARRRLRPHPFIVGGSRRRLVPFMYAEQRTVVCGFVALPERVRRWRVVEAAGCPVLGGIAGILK
jgi:hypothetical protein